MAKSNKEKPPRYTNPITVQFTEESFKEVILSSWATKACYGDATMRCTLAIIEIIDAIQDGRTTIII